MHTSNFLLTAVASLLASAASSDELVKQSTTITTIWTTIVVSKPTPTASATTTSTRAGEPPALPSLTVEIDLPELNSTCPGEKKIECGEKYTRFPFIPNCERLINEMLIPRKDHWIDSSRDRAFCISGIRAAGEPSCCVSWSKVANATYGALIQPVMDIANTCATGKKTRGDMLNYLPIRGVGQTECARVCVRDIPERCGHIPS